jgi:hypothetical protein
MAAFVLRAQRLGRVDSNRAIAQIAAPARPSGVVGKTRIAIGDAKASLSF